MSRGREAGRTAWSRTLKWAGKPSFWMMRAYFRAARCAIASVFAPVHTLAREEVRATNSLTSPRSSAHQLSGGEDESRRLRVTDAHDDGRKALQGGAQRGTRGANGRCEQPRAFGLYSAVRAWRVIVFRSSLQSRFTVATRFLVDGRQ